MQGWLTNSHNLLYKVILFLVYWFFKLLYRNKIYGAENFYSGSAILAANHASFYDPPFCLFLLRMKFTFWQEKRFLLLFYLVDLFGI